MGIVCHDSFYKSDVHNFTSPVFRVFSQAAAAAMAEGGSSQDATSLVTNSCYPFRGMM